MKSDFNTMTKAELRAYLVAHPNDQAAFYAFVDRFTSEASPETFPMPQSQAEMEETAQLIHQKVQQMNIRH
ncbi:DUF6887 family protein [Merismopedia glauca]|nr:hypothetical protein [Merismopedia glauca]